MRPMSRVILEQHNKFECVDMFSIDLITFESTLGMIS